MYSIRIFIIIIFVIFEVFHSATASLIRLNLMWEYIHDMALKPKYPSDFYNRVYQIYLRDLTLDGEEGINRKLSGGEDFKTFTGPLYLEVPESDAKDANQLVKEKKMSKANEAEKKPKAEEGFIRKLLKADTNKFEAGSGTPDTKDQIKAQTFVKQDIPQSVWSYENSTKSSSIPISNSNPKNYQPMSYGGKSLLNQPTSQNVFKPTSTFNFKKNDTIPSQTKNSGSFSDLQKLVDSANGVNTNKQFSRTMQALQNNPLTPVGSKVVTRNGVQYMVTMPAEIPVQTHSYEEPKGLNIQEVRFIRNQVFNQANMYRNRHGCGALTLNENINNHAQEWANYLAPKRMLIGRNVGQNDLYGETLYASSPTEEIGKAAVDLWYNQLRFIHVGDDDEALIKNSNPIHHMIQLLWKKSREIGIGVAKSAFNEYFIVVNYNPKGDVYPFLLDNLPIFTQDDIDTARNAHEALAGKMVTKKLKNNQLGQPVTDSDSVNQVNGSQQYTNGSQIAKSNDSDESPKRIELGNSKYTQLPEFKEPVPYAYKKPLGLSPIEVEQIRQDVLKKSNYYRSQMYNLKPLVLHKYIDNYAQEWANYLARTDQFKHRFNDGKSSIYGENLHRSTKILHVGEVAVDLWYYEVGLLGVNDDEEKLMNNDDAGHITQLLWKSSIQMGVGAAVSGKGHVIIVANYNPTGNVEYFYSYNVPRFTQEQIDEGKRLQQNIDNLKNTQREIPLNGQLVKLPGWYSKLYTN